MTTTLIKSSILDKAELLRHAGPAGRLDVWPFMLLYFTCIYVFFSGLLDVQYEDLPLVFGLPAVAALHLLSYLASYWSISWKCFLFYSKVSDLNRAQVICLIPSAHNGSSCLVPILRKKDPETGEEIPWIEWRQRVFLFDKDKKIFRKTSFPTNLLFSDYLAQAGGLSQEQADINKEKFGENKFKIPEPQFMELYKEQMLSPFFVFQLFCVALWLLDEYWYYSLFTLFMLLVFEATIVNSRLKNLSSLRNMVQKPRPIMVLRGGAWKSISTTELVPGDVCSILRPAVEGHLCPCDMVLLDGQIVADESILTGETTPQLKESIQHVLPSDQFSLKNHKVHVLHGGTRVINHVSEASASASASSSSSSSALPVLRFRSKAECPPDGGCRAFVVRTGFETDQGRLVRTILYSTERVTANNFETFLFIGFLLIFALCASGYVLYWGLEDPERSRYKLVLECILIITSVVPPELPIELSLAVNNSLIALAKLGIFCTEPFRIPLGGKVKFCCFDKTGTLTSDQLVLLGLTGISRPKSRKPLENDVLECNSSLPDEIQWTIAGCHSVVLVDEQLVGDPMETLALKAISWNTSKSNVTVRTSGVRQRVEIMSRFPFSSLLKRMSTVVHIKGDFGEKFMATVKGAPEVIEQYLAEVPDSYARTHKSFSRRGLRVIALAYKPLPDVTAASVPALTRPEVESDLIFAGFLVFDCPLKPDSLKAIEALLESSHEVVMITGDSPLTACKVAVDLKFCTKPILLLEPSPHPDEESFWTTIDEDEKIPLSDTTAKLAQDFDLCVSGKGLQLLQDLKLYSTVLRSIKVYARVSPEQKESVVCAFKEVGEFTLMCGDGTNDVGALKQAHLGVALLNLPTRKSDPSSSSSSSFSSSAAAPGPHRPIVPPTVSSVARPRGAAPIRAPGPSTPSFLGARPGFPAPPPRKGRVGPPTILDDEEISIVQLGDASIASPFSSKSSSIVSVIHILRQGRCTLVTTLQMFMILALNSLISAYSLSVLYLEGYKMGDTQATAIGMLVAFCFLFITRSQPRSQLSKERPASTIFSPRFVMTLLGQFAIHLASIIYVHDMALQAMAPEERPSALPKKPEGDGEEASKFVPTILNSSIFLMSTSMQLSTFAVNYRGHPFMQSLSENKPLRNCLIALGTIVVLTTLQWMPALNEYLEIYPFSDEYSSALFKVIALDFVAAFALDRLVSFITKSTI